MGARMRSWSSDRSGGSLDLSAEVSARERAASMGLRVGIKPVPKTGIESELGTDRRLATLYEATSITKRGGYWIGGNTVASGVTTSGYHKDNGDGTFTKVANMADIDPSDCLYVSEGAAARASHGEGPLLLIVWTSDHLGRRLVTGLDVWTSLARVASVPMDRTEATEALRE